MNARPAFNYSTDSISGEGSLESNQGTAGLSAEEALTSVQENRSAPGGQSAKGEEPPFLETPRPGRLGLPAIGDYGLAARSLSDRCVDMLISKVNETDG